MKKKKKSNKLDLEINLVGDMYLKSDTYSWRLVEKTEKWETTIGYYCDLRILIKDLFDRRLRMSNKKTLSQLIGYAKEQKALLREVIDATELFEKTKEELIK